MTREIAPVNPDLEQLAEVGGRHGSKPGRLNEMFWMAQRPSAALLSAAERPIRWAATSTPREQRWT
jgi:hypothetical protein